MTANAKALFLRLLIVLFLTNVLHAGDEEIDTVWEDNFKSMPVPEQKRKVGSVFSYILFGEVRNGMQDVCVRDMVNIVISQPTDASNNNIKRYNYMMVAKNLGGLCENVKSDQVSWYVFKGQIPPDQLAEIIDFLNEEKKTNYYRMKQVAPKWRSVVASHIKDSDFVFLTIDRYDSMQKDDFDDEIMFAVNFCEAASTDFCDGALLSIFLRKASDGYEVMQTPTIIER